MEQNQIHSRPSNGEEAELERITLTVGNAVREHRLDKYLHSRFGSFSRAMIQEIIRAGEVKVAGKTVKASFKIRPGDNIDLTLPSPPSKEIPPENIPLNIIYEDQDIIVLNKQAGIIVHPARGGKHGTLVNALVYYSDTLSSGLGEFRPGIVHRLDKNTTGVMVVAKNDIAQWKIARQFELRYVKKTYLAVVHGCPELAADRISAPLNVHPRIREKYAVRPETGRQAVTFYEVLESFQGFSLLKLTPKTGRTHQIRVHLSYIKHPIVADETYGGKLVYPWQLHQDKPKAEEPVINRVALHAHALEFTHPSTGKLVCFEAPLPPDIQNLLDMLRKHRSP